MLLRISAVGREFSRRPGPWIYLLLAWVGLWWTAGASWAGPPSEGGETGAGGPDPTVEAGPESPPVEANPKPGPTPSTEQTKLLARIDRLVERAQQINALVAGQLDPTVDVDELLTIDLREPEADRLRAMLEAIRAGRAERVAAEQAAAEQAAAAAASKRRRPAPLEPVALPEPPPIPAEADPLTRAEAELVRAHWRFWTLPRAERAELLVAHQARRDAVAQRRGAEAAAKLRLERMQQQGKQLAALIDGRLDPSVDLDHLLRVQLSAVDELASDERLGRALVGDTPVDPSPDSDPGSPNAPGSPAAPESPESADSPNSPESHALVLAAWTPSRELADALALAAKQLDAQRLRFASLGASERQAVLDRHAAQIKAAEDAAATAELLDADEAVVAKVEEELTVAVDKAEQAKRDRQQAEAAAVQARSEALRRIAEERARLLGVKEDHAVYEVDLATRKKASQAAHEIALEWDRRVSDLAQMAPGKAREAAADAMYTDLRAALADARDGLRATLGDIGSSESGVTPVGEPVVGLPADLESTDLAELRSEVEQSETELRGQELDVVWATADAGRDDIVMLNRARLTLLDLASDDLRSRMTGLAADGVAQTKREIDQIVLELRYRVLALPRIGRALLAGLETNPLPVVLAVFELVFAVIVFRYWRKRAGPTLANIRDSFITRERGNSRLNQAIAMGLWYVERIRGPLETLVLFAVVFEFVINTGEVLELQVVWLVVLWLNVGYTVILLVDAVAAHEGMVYGRGTTATAKLRIRSLRLVGLTIVLTGLILSLTEEVVGRGAIHKWVRSLVWIAAIPIVLVLIRWWRDYVFDRVRNDKDLPDNALVRWIRANTEGWASFPAAAVGGGYVFGRGLARWVLRRATALETTRRLLAWMFRREVARQAIAHQADEVPVLPIAAEEYAVFEPAKIVEDVHELSEPMRAVAAGMLTEVVKLKTSQRGTLSALIGERGAGKTMFLRRLAVALEEHDEAERAKAAEAAAEAAAAGEATQADPVSAESSSEHHKEYGRLTVRLIQCPPGGFRPLLRVIAESVGLSRNATQEQVVAALLQQTPLVFLVDDAHRLVRPAIGGLEGLDLFADFAREVSGDASWIASIGSAAWQYVSRARGDHVFFDQVLTMPSWNERQIGQLIRDRCALAKVKPNFDAIVIPRQFDVAPVGEDEARPTEAERAERGYYRILWDYSKGNPAVAMHFWRESLCLVPGAEAEQVKVRLFQEPPAETLDEVGATMHFVLRGVVQLEVASPADLVACTQLPPADVADALRFALARGWVDRVGSYGDRYRVTWHWYRAITNMLRRQHLLAI